MAKRWIRDEFQGEGETPLLGRETDTGQTWGSPTHPDDADAGCEFYFVEGGKVFFRGSNPGGLFGFHDTPRYCLTQPGSNTATTNTYEWWMPRFPDTGWSTWGFYTPAYALLCFESIGQPSWGGGAAINAIMVGYDPRDHAMTVSSPANSDRTFNSMGPSRAATHYSPLPALDDPEHPDEYYLKLVRNPSGLTLHLNDDLVFENESLPHGALPGTRSGVGMNLGRTGMPGTSWEPNLGGTWDFEDVIEFKEFRLNYEPVELEDDSKLRVYNRHDGRNASTAPYVYRGGGGDIWCYGGYN